MTTGRRKLLRRCCYWPRRRRRLLEQGKLICVWITIKNKVSCKECLYLSTIYQDASRNLTFRCI